MSQATYKTAIEFVLKWEVGFDKHGRVKADGGYTNYKNDPGGATKWGISQRAHPTESIADMPLERALELYRRDYWDIYKAKIPAIDLDAVQPDLAVCMFDTGVNCGSNRALHWYREAVKEKDPTKALLSLRMAHYDSLHEKMPQFYKGWINRLNDLKKLVEIIRAEP